MSFLFRTLNQTLRLLEIPTSERLMSAGTWKVIVNAVQRIN